MRSAYIKVFSGDVASPVENHPEMLMPNSICQLQQLNT